MRTFFTGLTAIALLAPLSAALAASSPTLDYAASELSSYASRLCGQPPQVTLQSDRPGEVPRFEQADSYELTPTPRGLEIHGSNDRSVLYGVYALIRSWGVQFSLSGDVLPERSDCALPKAPIRKTASLKMRGVHPYPDFLSGPSSWNEEDFEAYVRQLPKLGINFLGIHQYTYEPYVNYELDGIHPRSGSLETTALGVWGYGSVQACRFEVGRDLFGDSCVWGARAALEPTNAEERYAAAQALMSRALERAHELGLVTAFGFEPLSQDPEFDSQASTPEGLARVVNARVDGVLHAFPHLDYLWLFSGEATQASAPDVSRAYSVIAAAEQHLHQAWPGKTLMVGGWNAEPFLEQYDSGKDGIRFGDDAIFTTYGNYDPWRTVEWSSYPDFKGMHHAHALATWCQYDGRLLAGLQPNVTAYESLLKIMRDSGSLGFFFLHWDLRLCDQNLAYLADAAWADSDPQPASDFYAGYFTDRFGFTPARAQQLTDAWMLLEDLNRSFGFGSAGFWLMAPEWVSDVPLDDLYNAVHALRLGKPIPDDLRAKLTAQRDQAAGLADVLSQLDAAAARVEAAQADCARDTAGFAFLAHRYRYFTEYLKAHVDLSLALSKLLDAPTPAQALAQFRPALDLARWRQVLSLYAADVQGQGEKGVVVSLNQKILYPLERIQKELSRRRRSRAPRIR